MSNEIHNTGLYKSCQATDRNITKKTTFDVKKGNVCKKYEENFDVFFIIEDYSSSMNQTALSKKSHTFAIALSLVVFGELFFLFLALSIGNMVAKGIFIALGVLLALINARKLTLS